MEVFVHHLCIGTTMIRSRGRDWNEGLNKATAVFGRDEMTQLPGPPRLGPADSYLHCIWIEAAEDAPVYWYDELDESRWSIRCVRKYRDGRIEAHSYASANWRDVMPEAPIPPLAIIN
jgi:hypothetical protein